MFDTGYKPACLRREQAGAPVFLFRGLSEYDRSSHQTEYST